MADFDQLDCVVLSGFKPEERLLFAHFFDTQKFSKDDALFTQGEETGCLWILDGNVEVSLGGDSTTLNAGDTLGVFSLLGTRERKVNAVAKAEVTVLEIMPGKFEKLKTHAPAVALKLLSTLQSTVMADLEALTS